MEEKISIVQQETENLLKLLEITGTVRVEKEEESFFITIETEENALLIGKHGNTLSSLQTIISLMIAKKLGEFVRITLEIGNYRKEREDYLNDLVLRLKEDVVATGFDKSIRGLKPWERRLIHMSLQNDQEVATQSEGEGRDRVLVIKKK